MSEPSPSAEALLEHRDFLRAIARGLLGDDALAEDVAQESMLAALQRPPRGPNPRAWFGAVARNLALLRRRSEAHRRRREERVARPEALPSTVDAVAHLDMQRRIVEAVRALDEPYRTTVVQRFFLDWSAGEIARRSGVPTETVRTRLRRALEQLRRRLDGEYGGDRRAWSLLLAPMAYPAAGKTAAAGVAVMTMKTKLTLAIVVAALLTLLAGWRARTGEHGARSGQHRAEARAPVPAEERDGTRSPDLPAPVDFARVDRDRDLHGIVVAPDGGPVAGARLVAVFRPWERTSVLSEPSPEPGPSTRSASDGSFRLPLQRGALVDLRVHASGYAEVVLALLQAGERVRVTLAPPTRTVVRVVDGRGNPVADARVELARYARNGGARIEREQRTGSDGSATFDDLPAGVDLSAVATHPGYGSSLGAAELTAGDEIEIALNEGRWFEGRVFDGETGAPIADARVGMNWVLRPETRTDAAGRYRLNGWIAGRNVFHAIHVIAAGYPQATTRITNDSVIDFALPRGDFVTGRVVAPGGAAVPRARVAVIGDEDWSLSMAHGLTDPIGRFQLGPLSRSMPHAVVIMAPGYGRTLAGIRPRSDGAGTIELGDVVLPLGLAIEGRVEDSLGRPLARVPVVLDGWHAAPGLAEPPLGVGYGREEERLTDDLGRFRFVDLGPGRYTLRVQRRGDVPVERAVELGDRDERDLVLALPGGRPFTVIVEDDAGRPVPFADVVADHEAGRSYGRSGSDGRVELTVLGPIDRVEVVSIAQGPDGTSPALRGLPRVLDLSADASDVVLVLERGDPITGFVADPNGKGVGRARVVAAWEGGSWFTFTSAQGDFRAVVPPGIEVTLAVSGRMRSDTEFDPDLASDAVRVAAGARDVRLTALPAARTETLRVRVLDPDGAPAQGARVSCQGMTVESDREGAARLTSLPRRAIRVEVRVEGLAPPMPVDVVPRGQEITLRCRAGVWVRGRVIASTAMPAAGARVLVVAGEEEFETVTAADGGFGLVVPAGTEHVGLVALSGDERAHVERHRLSDGAAVLELRTEPPGR